MKFGPFVPGLILVLSAAAAGAAVTRGAALDGAAVESRGSIVELHFKLRGPRPLWHLEGHRQELAILLEHTRVAIAPELVADPRYAPVKAVHAVALKTGAAALLIEVDGRVDYAVAFVPHDLIVRFARAGAAPDIAAPIELPAPRPRSASAPSRRSTAAAEIPRPVAPAVPTAQQRPSAIPPAPAGSDTAARAMPVAVYAPGPGAIGRLVVIDPGHGGRDPGTRSAGGLAEKDLALQIAWRLQRALTARGVTARMTRTDDRFLSLAERTQAANHNAANLFVSIHLNSSPDRATSGIETYYLNNTTDRATIRLARMENGVAGGYGDSAIPNLNYILTDLRQGYKANESAALSRMIESESVAAADAALGVKVNDLGARQGPFYVLVGAEMPAVLVECGFLSNAVEAARLADARYQQALAEGIAAAVVNYFNSDSAVGNL